ncbi:MAG: mechanosensitive ion channel [Calothrix sp. SM1_7_51]|nr:mechanosensitive ion channel [Calothrix sp. SM1_7_51]
MENQLQIWEIIKHKIIDSGVTLANIPLTKIVLVTVNLVLIQALKQVILPVIINRIERLTTKTNTTLDDELIQIIKPPLGWLVFLCGLWVSQLVLAPELGLQLNQSIGKILNVFAISIGAYIIYRVSPLLGQMLGNVTARTETDLDNLIVPYLPKLFQTAAILIVVLKGAELLLGASASALVGLLGGAGVAFGLLIKDVIYDWFCTVVIFIDKIYQPGDRLTVAGIDGFVNVLEIGLRSTKLRVTKWDSIKKIPNSKMIGGVVENWTQNATENPSYGINMILKIDGISASKSMIVYQRLQEIPKSIDLLADNCQVRLEGFEGNARIFKVRAFAKELSKYYQAEAALNIAVLQLLEEESIEQLQVQLIAEIDKYSSDNKKIANQELNTLNV